MSLNANKGSFVKQHWDWLVLGGTVLVLLGAVAFYVLGTDVENEAGEDIRGQVKKAKAANKCAEPVKIPEYALDVFKPAVQIPPGNAALPVHGGFLASERRVYCSVPVKEGENGAVVDKGCGAVIPSGLAKCPVCSVEFVQTNKVAELQVVRDGDGDGMDDAWEKKHRLNPKSPDDAAKDQDGDTFTNLEEFNAGTDPRDPKSHPDYLDYLKLKLPLNETTLPFYFQGVMPMGGGKVRLRFYDPKRRNDYGKRGMTYQALVGEEIGKTGFVVRNFEKKTERRKLKGGTGMVGEVDVSEATLERKSDRKVVRLVVDERKPVAIDVQATMTFTRGAGAEYTVVPLDEIKVGDEKCGALKCKVVKIERIAKGGEVTLEVGPSKTVRKIRALEP